MPRQPALLIFALALAACAPATDDLVDQRYEAYRSVEKAHWLAESLDRKAELEPVILPAIAERGLPERVAAVALVESGFENIAARPACGLPAGGVWQMIPSTARRFGLRVDDELDERQDVVLETAAALDLLVDLHERYNDWGLAYAAYNVGHERLDRVIEAEGTDDLFVLIRTGELPTYAADVLAAERILGEATGTRP